MSTTVYKTSRYVDRSKKKSLVSAITGVSGGWGTPTGNYHNSLLGLQGGEADYYYHLDSAQYTNVDAIVSLTDGYIPYRSASTHALINSPLYTDGTKIGIGTITPNETFEINGNIRGNQDGALRISTCYGYVDVGPKNTEWCHFGTDRDKFWFSKSVYLDNGTLSAFDTNDLRFQTNGTTRVQIVSSTGDMKNPNFSEGFQGDKWRITEDGAAEFESMRIRGGLSVYELIINQLHYQNGGLVIGAGAGKVKSIYDSTVGTEKVYFETPEGTGMSPFSAGAIVMIQIVDINRSTVVKKIVRQVSAIQADYRCDFTATSGWTPATDDVGIFEIGDEVVAIGHTSTASLQNSIYLSATDADNPFMRVYSGVNAYSKWNLSDKSTIKTQIGNLASLASWDVFGDGSFVMPSSPGFGIFTSNGYFSGVINANSGLIGGWTINSNYLAKDTGTNNTSSGMSPTDYPFYAGATYANRESAPFRITPTGSLTATGIAELGTNTLEYEGRASNVAIKNADIWENSYNGDNSALHINRLGYQGGSSKYRNLRVYDGKGIEIFAVEGASQITYAIYFKSLKDAIFSSDIRVDGTSQFNGVVNFNNITKFNANANFNYNIYALSKLSVGSSYPNTYSCVDFSAGKRDGTNPGAMILPIMTTTQRNALTAYQGMILYNSTTGLIDVCTAAGWRYLQTANY